MQNIRLLSGGAACYRGQNQKYNFLFNGRNRIKHWKTNKNKNKRLTEASLFKVESIWIWF